MQDKHLHGGLHEGRIPLGGVRGVRPWLQQRPCNINVASQLLASRADVNPELLRGILSGTLQYRIVKVVAQLLQDRHILIQVVLDRLQLPMLMANGCIDHSECDRCTIQALLDYVQPLVLAAKLLDRLRLLLIIIVVPRCDLGERLDD